MPDTTDSAFAQACVAGEAAVRRLIRFDGAGEMSLAGAYAIVCGALGVAQAHDGDVGWYDLLDPLDVLTLGAAFPNRFSTGYRFANARDRWLQSLRGSVHGKSIETFVRLAVGVSDEYAWPVNDGELMLAVAGRLEDAKLDQPKLPRTMLPDAELTGGRVAVGSSTTAVLPAAPHDSADLVARFWRDTGLDLEIGHDS